MIRPSRVAAGAVLAVLVGAVAAVPSGERVLPTHGTDVPVDASRTPPRSMPERTPPPATSVVVTVTSPADVEKVVMGAMRAWGRFAVEGDLAEVAGWFATDGPQYRQFEKEAEALAAEPVGPPAYAVLTEDLEVEEAGDEAQARGRFVFVRTGEVSQSFQWVIVLIRVEERWLVWTVEEAAEH